MRSTEGLCAWQGLRMQKGQRGPHRSCRACTKLRCAKQVSPHMKGALLNTHTHLNWDPHAHAHLRKQNLHKHAAPLTNKQSLRATTAGHSGGRLGADAADAPQRGLCVHVPDHRHLHRLLHLLHRVPSAAGGARRPQLRGTVYVWVWVCGWVWVWVCERAGVLVWVWV